MNWDKQSIAAVVVGAAALFLWYAYGPKMMGETAPAPAVPAPQTAVQGASAAPQTTVKTSDKSSKAAPAAVQTALPAVELKNDKQNFSCLIDPVSGAIQQISFNKLVPANDGKNGVVLTNIMQTADPGKLVGAFSIRSSRGPLQTLKVEQSKLINDGREYVLLRKMRDNTGSTFSVMTVYKLIGDYRIQAGIQIINDSNLAVSVPELIVSAGDLQPWYRMSGDLKSSSQELHTIEFCTPKGKVDYENTNCDQDDWAELNGKVVRWGGVANRFFAQLLKSGEMAKLKLDRIEYPAGSKEYVVNANLQFDSFTLAPKSVKALAFDYYVGPKLPELLNKFDSEGSEVMHLGWFPIDFLAYIMLKMLNWLYGFVGSFGWSIIFLTLLIRIIFFPVTMKANASMREMQVLSPKLKEIREKYKDEPMVAQAKMSELYREHNVNPLGGCLPMLIQIPVFIALYYALGSAAELRMQSFWWIKDLAQPDTVVTILGLPINPLIIAWTGLMVVQQKLTPTTMDPMQARIMLIMPLVMVFILYSLPAALTLYWTVSQIFSIAQMMYQNKLRQRQDAEREKRDKENKSDKPKIVRS